MKEENQTIHSIQLHFKGHEGKHYSYQMASEFQGALMQAIDSEYADKLHESGAHPYSQYLQVDGLNIIWTVNTLTKEAYDNVACPILDPRFRQVELETHQDILTVERKCSIGTNYDDLVKQYYLGAGDPIIHIRFLTPTSFKSNQQYCIFPTTRLIFQSLMMKFDASSDTSTIYSEDLVDQFDRFASIVGYRLKSTLFYLAGARIPSFTGDITIRVRGSRQLANIARMLAAFGAYSGVGIKTGMGMGAMMMVEESTKESTKQSTKRSETIA